MIHMILMCQFGYGFFSTAGQNYVGSYNLWLKSTYSLDIFEIFLNHFQKEECQCY